MKNLLSVLAVSTLVGTGASNLNKDISIQNVNSSNPFINALINDIKTKMGAYRCCQ